MPENRPELTVYTDGGARGNPGPAAAGVVIMTTKGEVLDRFGRYLGRTTNNQAEYRAIRLALARVADFKPARVRCFLDSELAVRQLNGQYRVKNQDLRPIYEDIKKMAQDLSVTFTHVPRAQNKLADAEVNKAIDRELGLTKP